MVPFIVTIPLELKVVLAELLNVACIIADAVILAFASIVTSVVAFRAIFPVLEVRLTSCIASKVILPLVFSVIPSVSILISLLFSGSCSFRNFPSSLRVTLRPPGVSMIKIFLTSSNSIFILLLVTIALKVLG